MIRPARAADVAAMFRIRTSVRENALDAEALARLGITPPAIAAAIEAAACAWVAEDGGTVRGFSMVDLDTACLFAAFVLPGHEGRGLGRGLVRAAEAALFRHHDLAWLETAADSRAAGFYRHLGWGGERDLGAGDIRLEKRRPQGADSSSR
ncbi:MAG: GNAT family N-acetyltransferase [Burkholderiaceae bacterium]|jgi:GNAT superfamily N-acetyltransferase|nr:GNAT family N-acetyltransferase [Burkholderiaceae bacterium]